MAPVSWNGSTVLYQRGIRPFFLKHQAAMDSVVSDLTGKAKSIANKVTKEGRARTHKHTGDQEGRARTCEHTHRRPRG